LGTAATQSFLFTSQSSLFQSAGAYLTTAMQSNAGSDFLSTSQSSLFQQTSQMSLYQATSLMSNYQSAGAYLTTAMQSDAGSNFVNTSQSSLFQATSLMSNYQSANAGYLTSQSNQAFSASGSSSTFQTLQFGNSNGISFSISNGSIVGTVATNYQSQGAYLTTAMQSNAVTLSNIKLSAGTLSSNRSDMTFSNANGVSFGLETNGVITASVAAAGGAQTGISGLSAGTTQMTSGTASFADGGGVSFGINGNTITATVRTDYQSSGNYLTTAMASNASTNFAGIGSAITNGTMTFGTGGLSLNLSNHLTTAMASNASTNFAGIGSAITNGTMTFGTGGLSLNLSNHLTTARASNDAIGLNTALTANGVAWTVNSSGLSLNIPAFLTTAMQSQSSSNFAGVGSAITNGTMTYGTGGLSLNLSNHLTTAMASNAGSNFVGLNSALTANGVSATINSSGVSLNFPAFLTTAMASNQSSNFAGLGFTSASTAGTNIVATLSTNGLSMGIPNYVTNAAGGGITNVNISAGTTAQNLSNFVFANSNNVSFGLSGSTITASINAGAGGGIALANSETTYTSGTANLIASGALTIGSTTGQSFYFSAPAQSSLSATGQVSISVNGSTISIGVPNAITLNQYAPFELRNNTTFSSLGQSSVYLQKIWPSDNFSFSVIERWASLSFASSTNNASVNYSIQYGIYSRDTGTNNTRMTLMGSSQMDIRAAFSSNSSMAASIVVGANTVATGSAGTGLYSNITAGKHIYFPYATSLAAGNEYWVAFHVRSASTITSTPLRIAFLEFTNINNLTWGKINSANFFATNASNVDDFGQGVYSVQSAGLPATIADNQITNQVSLGRQYIQFDNN
jgi:hypothetical protein